jgi:transposase
MQLRYNYRLYPAPGQRIALARAFGCARVVFNDALAAREAAHGVGLPYVTDVELSARLTAAKATSGRAWLNEVSAAVLQQALADLNTAYRNYFTSIKGERAGPKMGKPRFRSQASSAGDPVHRQRPVQGAGQREAAAAEDRGRARPLVPTAAVRATYDEESAEMFARPRWNRLST